MTEAKTLLTMSDIMAKAMPAYDAMQTYADAKRTEELFEKVINESLSKSDNSGILYINLFTDNERYFLNQAKRLEEKLPAQQQINLDQFKECIYAEYKKRDQQFQDCLTKKLPGTKVCPELERLPETDAEPDKFKYAYATFALNETSVKALRQEYPLSAEKTDHLKKGLENSNNYDVEGGMFKLDYLSASEAVFIKGFVRENILPITHSAFGKLTLNLHKDAEKRIEATGLDIKVQSNLVFLGRLLLLLPDAQKLNDYFESQKSVVQNAAGVGFVQSPISQPALNQQTTNTTVTTTNTTSTTTTTTTTNPGLRI